MATYGENYYKVLQKVTNQYLGLHNLNSLQHFERKIGCYNTHATKPQEYYQCFERIETQREKQAKDLNTNYTSIEDEYKLCTEGCKSLADYENKSCTSKCGHIFSESVTALYTRFYQQRVGDRKQYKKAKN